MERMIETRTARNIVSMLRAAVLALPNDREKNPLTSYQQNIMMPGMTYAMELIEAAYKLSK